MYKRQIIRGAFGEQIRRFVYGLLCHKALQFPNGYSFIKTPPKTVHLAHMGTNPVSYTHLMEMEWLEFDSPFLYAIVDLKTALPLFIGLLERPA